MASLVLIISGSIAAYKSLELIRLMRNENVTVRVILTEGGAHFVTPLSCAALSGEAVFSDLFSLSDEAKMGHIRLAREADLVVVAPASADFLAKVAGGQADNLALATLLTTRAPVLMVPAMNGAMWENPATQENVRILKGRGVAFIGPDEGELACGELGVGKMREPSLVGSAILEKLFGDRPLKGIKALVTAGPTQEPIDPIRFFSNGSSGKQGYAIAESLLHKGADVILVTGPTPLAPPLGVQVMPVQTAEEMWNITCAQLPMDVAICTAAVVDWRPEKRAVQKVKKREKISSFSLRPTVDILDSLATHPKRPRLLVGFAAETENILENARLKLSKCDWVIANDISGGVLGSDYTEVYWVTPQTHELWPKSLKKDMAEKLVSYITGALT